MKKTIVSIVALVCLAALPLAAQAPRNSRGTHGSNATNQRVYNDSTRLASLLHDMQQGRANLDGPSWTRIANEANTLSDRIYSNAGTGEGRRNARELRTHIRAMRASAMRGDAAGARDHARQAFPYTTTLMDWSSPDHGQDHGPMHH